MNTEKLIRVILYQKPLGITIPHGDVEEMKEFHPHFICFPEYFFVSTRLGNHGQTPHNQNLQMRRINRLSRELDTVIIGGTMPELSNGTLYNTCHVFNRGDRVGSYRKRHLFFAEEGVITPGHEYKVFQAYDLTFGVLICADIFHDSAFTFMKENKAAIIFSPTFSPRKDETAEVKFQRDRDLYVRGSHLSGAYIVKVCGVPSAYRPYIQARSLISSPDSILYRVDPAEEDRAMIIKKEILLSLP